MITLGIDCSTKQSSVCIFNDNNCIYTCVQNTGVTHSQNLLDMINNALNICSLNPTDINLFAATQGPGSFTGLRIALAVIKGMASVNNTPCVGVSSLKALKASYEFDEIIIPTIDARRNQIYTNIINDDEIIFDDTCLNISELENFIKTCNKNIFFVGDGSDLCYNIYEKYSNVKKTSNKTPCIAYGACLLALEKFNNNDVNTHFDLSPSYLRLAQAERELKEKLEANL